MLTVTKLFKFEAAHHLPNYEGKCHNVHGHSYKLEVTVTGKLCENGSETGMICDFSRLKSVVNEVVIDKLDHNDLNSVYENPTCEVMVVDIFSRLAPPLSQQLGVNLVSVRLWETDTSYAEQRSEVY